MEQSNNSRSNPAQPLPGALANAPLVSHARFSLGDQVKHKIFGFRGIVFDIDPVFANTEEWYESIPAAIRPDRDQPFYHLIADNGEQSYIAYVSQQNLVADEGAEPIDHPAVAMLFQRMPNGGYELDAHRWH